MLKNKWRGFLFIILLMLGSTVSAAEKVVAEMSVDHAWGLLLGDEVIVTATLPINDRSEIDEENLPAIDQRQGFWLTLREISFDAAETGFINMALRYQVVNTGNEAHEVMTPDFTVRKTDNSLIVIPGVAIMLSMLLPEEIEAGSAAALLRADHKAPLFETAALGKKTAFWLSLAGLCLLLSTLWHFIWRTRHRQPFEQALLDLRKVKDDNLEAGARALHEAFNRTAGETIVQSAVSGLLDENKNLHSLAGEIDAFYKASSAFFFNPSAQTDLSLENIRKLAKSCRRAERFE